MIYSVYGIAIFMETNYIPGKVKKTRARGTPWDSGLACTNILSAAVGRWELLEIKDEKWLYTVAKWAQMTLQKIVASENFFSPC